MHFVSWEGGCLLIGQGGVVPSHSHYAIQISFGAERGIRFRPSESEEWTEYGGAIIASRQPHSMDATRLSFGALLLIEPETREGRALTERYLEHGGIAALPDHTLTEARDTLFSAWNGERSERAVVDAARQAVRVLTHGVEPSVVSDERIVRAISYVRSHLDAPLRLDDVAGAAFLSPSRFRHLFVEQTGMALRPYILWRRFLRVWELLMKGESLSAAAHAAGFADAAHLTRTSRRMFGIPPSALRIAGPLSAGATAPRESRGLR